MPKWSWQIALGPSLTVLEVQGPTCHDAGETTFHAIPHSFGSLKQTPGTKIWPSMSPLTTLANIVSRPVSVCKTRLMIFVQMTFIVHRTSPLAISKTSSIFLLFILSLFPWPSQPRVGSGLKGRDGMKVLVLESPPEQVWLCCTDDQSLWDTRIFTKIKVHHPSASSPLPGNTLQNGLRAQSLLCSLCQSFWP